MECTEEIFVLIKQGSEARIYSGSYLGKPCILKERFVKAYRHPQLDREITKERLKSEARSLVRCRMAGVHAPTVYRVDTDANHIMMEHISDGVTVKEFIKSATCTADIEQLASTVGSTIGLLHLHNIIHGDLTTSNLLVRNGNLCALTAIDFGLSFISSSAEDKGVDLYVLERALLSTHPDSGHLFGVILDSYWKTNRKDGKETLKKFEEIRLRGRKRLMIG